MKLSELVSISEDNMAAVVQSLEQIEQALQSNTYVRTTTRALTQLISDVKRNPIILVVGRQGVGKTSVINAYLRSPLLCSRQHERTKVHSLVQYSDIDELEATFFDGVEAQFDLSKLELLSVSDRFAAEILREQMELLTVYTSNPYAQAISFIDTCAFETTSSEQYYISDAILQRVDDIFYVIRADEPVEQVELNWLAQLNERLRIKPICIVNYSDQELVNQQNIVPYVRDMRYVSAKQLLQIADQAPQDTQFSMLDDAVQEVIANGELRVQKLTRRLFTWLHYFTVELESIVQREPLKLSVGMNMHGQEQLQKRNQAIIEEYELEYEQYSCLFEPIQTLFQFVRLIEANSYLLEPQTIMFCRLAEEYQQALREYRTKYAEYNELFKKMQEHVEAKAQGGFTIIKKLFGEKESTFDVAKVVGQLNLQRGLLELMYERIRQIEAQIIEAYQEVHTFVEYTVKQHANQVLAKLEQFKEVQQRNFRNHQYVARKIEEFDGVRQAQQLVSILIADLLMTQQQLSTQQRERLQHLHQRIAAVAIVPKVEQPTASAGSTIMLEKPLAPFQPLQLSINMLCSDYPEVPMYVKDAE